MLNQLLLTSYRSIVMKKREREGRSSALSLLTTSEILQQKKKFEKIDPQKKGLETASVLPCEVSKFIDHL
jgi:hypothetical protein